MGMSSLHKGQNTNNWSSTISTIWLACTKAKMLCWLFGLHKWPNCYIVYPWLKFQLLLCLIPTREYCCKIPNYFSVQNAKLLFSAKAKLLKVGSLNWSSGICSCCPLRAVVNSEKSHCSLLPFTVKIFFIYLYKGGCPLWQDRIKILTKPILRIHLRVSTLEFPCYLLTKVFLAKPCLESL